MTVTGGSSSVAARWCCHRRSSGGIGYAWIPEGRLQKAVNSILKGSPALAVEQVIKTALRML